jgi:MFS family permease
MGALLAAVSAVALVASCSSQALSQRREGSRRRDQLDGLLALATGLLGLVAASPLHSLAVLVAGAALTGAGHGVGFLDAQQELNEIAPAERRGEVTAAFVAAIYFLVASSVIATGLLDLRLSLQVSVGAVALVLVALALVRGRVAGADRATRTSSGIAARVRARTNRGAPTRDP